MGLAVQLALERPLLLLGGVETLCPTQLPSPIGSAFGVRDRSVASKVIMMPSSPGRTRCAAAPSLQMQPEPRSLAIV